MDKIDIFSYFPSNIRIELNKYINEHNYNTLEEIRIRVNKPIILKFNDCSNQLNYIIQTKDILNIMQYITENSLYSYQKQICEGFITLKGGHRVGISGNVVTENEKVINVSIKIDEDKVFEFLESKIIKNKEVDDGNIYYLTIKVKDNEELDHLRMY